MAVSIEALLSHFTAIEKLHILFNDCTMGKEKIQKLQTSHTIRKKEASNTILHEIRFAREKELGAVRFKESVCCAMAHIAASMT